MPNYVKKMKEKCNNDASTNQSSTTTNTNNKMVELFDYLCTNPEAKIKFRASDVILKIYSDRSYLSASNSRSRAREFYYLGDNIPLGQPEKPQGSIY